MLYFEMGGSVFTCGRGAVAWWAASMVQTHKYYRCCSSPGARHFSLFRHYNLLRQQGCLPEKALMQIELSGIRVIEPIP